MSKEPKIAQEISKILEQNHLLSAKQIHANLNNYNKTSIYRAIEKLSSQGLICKQTFGNEAKFELRDDHHDHAVCNKCEKVEAVECSSKEKNIPGFKIDHHHTVLYGVCDSCVIE